jgi:hypothetical protein
MTNPDDRDREDAERRVADAKVQLAAAERAYREVVPCEHRTMTIRNGEEFSCADCCADLPDPRGCQHRRIDNDTEQCTACGEKMLRVHRERVTVLSAPNKVACTVPECDGGPGCENPDGLYVPDVSRQREVPIRWDITYDCARCHYEGDMFSVGEENVWSCGRHHEGDSIPIRGAVSA